MRQEYNRANGQQSLGAPPGVVWTLNNASHRNSRCTIARTRLVEGWCDTSMSSSKPNLSTEQSSIHIFCMWRSFIYVWSISFYIRVIHIIYFLYIRWRLIVCVCVCVCVCVSPTTRYPSDDWPYQAVFLPRPTTTTAYKLNVDYVFPKNIGSG